MYLADGEISIFRIGQISGKKKEIEPDFIEGEIWIDGPFTHNDITVAAASDLGRIKTATTKHIITRGSLKGGYYWYQYNDGTIKEQVAVHHFIAVAFLGWNGEGFGTIDHIDRNSANNKASNLRIMESFGDNIRNRGGKSVKEVYEYNIKSHEFVKVWPSVRDAWEGNGSVGAYGNFAKHCKTIESLESIPGKLFSYSKID